ncbi:Nucleotidyltransferase, partial [Martensiomyces pterosporus]
HGKLPDISDIINEEVVRFVEYISPTPEEHQMRTWVIERLQRVLDSMKMIDIAPKAKCFGSFNTRLYLPTSDIDMTVMLYDKGTTNVSARYQTKEGIRRYLYTLAKELKNAGFCTRCEVIAHARVPIIKTKENITGIAVDISINADSGLGSAAVQRSFSEHVYPYSLRAIVLVIKQFLSQRSMNEVYTGGMGSYAITLLAVSFLQMHPRVRSGGLDIAKNLGVFLIEFFELYGKRFNYDQICISVRENGRYLDKRQKGMHNMGQPYLLSIEDPCDITNDVTKGTFGINRIKQTFGGAYDLINNAVFAYHQT